MIELPDIKWLAEKAKHIIRLVVYLQWASFRFWNSALDSQVVSAGMWITILVLVNLLHCFSYEIFCTSACVFISLGSILYLNLMSFSSKKKMYLMIINMVASLQHFQCCLETWRSHLYYGYCKFSKNTHLIVGRLHLSFHFSSILKIECTHIWILVAGKVMCGRKYSCYSYTWAFRSGSGSFGRWFGYWWIYIW